MLNTEWFDPGDPLSSAVRYIKSLSPRFDWVGVYVLRGGELELGPFIGAPTEHTRIKIGSGVCGTAVALEQDMNVPDVSKVDNYLACSTETKSELVVLIRDQRHVVVGQIDIDSHTHGAFGPAEEAAVRTVADVFGSRWPQQSP